MESRKKNPEPIAIAILLSLLMHATLLAPILWWLMRPPPRPVVPGERKIALDLRSIHTPSETRVRTSLRGSIPTARPAVPRQTDPQAAASSHQASPSKRIVAHEKSTPHLSQPSARRAGLSKSKKPKHPRIKRKNLRRSGSEPKRIRTARKRPRRPSHQVGLRHRSGVRHEKRAGSTIHRPSPANRRLIRKLYGSSYSRMSRAQQQFIDRYLREIIRISQRTLNYLGYPLSAARMQQQGTNLLRFYLHPNGDISGLKILRSSGSAALDRQSIEVIKTAYMHYPRPRVTTRIVIYVNYRLY